MSLFSRKKYIPVFLLFLCGVVSFSVFAAENSPESLDENTLIEEHITPESLQKSVEILERASDDDLETAENIVQIIEDESVVHEVVEKAEEKVLEQEIPKILEEKKSLSAVVEIAETLEKIEKTKDLSAVKIQRTDSLPENNDPKPLEIKKENALQEDVAVIEKILEKSEAVDEKIREELEKIARIDDNIALTRSESTKEYLGQKKVEQQEKVVAIHQEKLEVLEEINAVFEEQFYEDLEVIFVEDAVQGAEEKIEEAIETETQEIQAEKKALVHISSQAEKKVKQDIVQQKEENLLQLQADKEEILEEKEEEAQKIVSTIKEEQIIEPPIFFAFQEISNFSNDEKIAEQESLSFVLENFLQEPSSDASLKEVISFLTQVFSGNVNTVPPRIVAIIDTGIDTKHEDLAGQFWKSETCVDENGDAIEGGCLHGGWDFVENDADPYDIKYAHGTAVAGIVAAQNNNDSGISSLGGSHIEIMALRACCSLEGYFEAQTIAKSIHFAVNNGAEVINMSFGGPTHAKSIEDAIAYAEKNGVIVVTAAGNYGHNNDEKAIYPARFNEMYTNVMSVGALNRDGSFSSFSNYGDSVDIAAPGELVLTTVPGNEYKRFTGTSFATPLVSAGLMLP